MNTPDISVVMSVYNDERYLPEAIESLLQQQGPSFEIIAVNDGSTDASADLLADYARRFPDLLRVLHQKNQGLTQALIRGCREARAPLLARQDADDLSRPGRLAAQHNLLTTNPNLAFVSSFAEFIGPNQELLDRIQRPIDPNTATQRLLHEKLGPPCHGTVLMRRSAYEAVGGYRPAFYYGQDADLWLRMAHHGQINYVPEYLYAYRVQPNNISISARHLQHRFGQLGQACHRARLNNQPEAPLLAAAEALHPNRNPDTSTPRQRNQRIAAGNYYIASLLLRQNNPAAARNYLREATRLDPTHWKAWIKRLTTR